MILTENLKVKNNSLFIGGVAVKDLAKNYGTPLFALDKNHIKNMIKAYSSSLNDNYSGYGIVLYASKAFSCKGIYKIINECNIGCDVVSAGELYTALSADFPADKIYFHGNNKTYSELEYAIKNNVKCIVIDAISEMDDIQEICAKLGVKQEVLIRVNPGIEAHTHHYIQTSKIDSKFGFSISTGDAIEAISYALTKNNLILKGLHCHIGSQIFEKKSFIIAVDKMLSFYKDVKNQLNYEFSVFNLGGGFGIHYTNEDPTLKLNDYYDFVKIISDSVTEGCSKYNLNKPYLLLEPGRSIVANAGITIYKIGRVKEIKGVKNYLAIDGGMFENPRYALYQAKYTVVAPEKMSNNPEKTYSIVGKCCESGDVIAENVLLPEMKEGELLTVLATGAYNYSMSSNYNRNLIPPVILIDGEKTDYLVKPQTFEDLVRNDV